MRGARPGVALLAVMTALERQQFMLRSLNLILARNGVTARGAGIAVTS